MCFGFHRIVAGGNFLPTFWYIQTVQIMVNLQMRPWIYAWNVVYCTEINTPNMSPLLRFWKPTLLLILLILGLVLGAESAWSAPLLGGSMVLGGYRLVWDMIASLIKKQFVLDYIAFAAMLTAALMGEWLVGSIIALMLATGEELEAFGEARAKSALSSLLSRIPHQVTIRKERTVTARIPLDEVERGMILVIKKGEMIPVDGFVAEGAALVDEASVTGEPLPVERTTGGPLRAGTINVGETLLMQARGSFQASSYARLVHLVAESQEQKAPLVRLADQYASVFTLITFVLCAVTYLVTRDPQRVLAVLVLATPCPLIIAAPIAFIGGINAAAKKRIIAKHPASLEVLSRMTDLIVDKTGTLTLGTPTLLRTEVLHTLLPPKVGLRIAASLEQYSLHPFAKALLAAHGTGNMLLAPTDIHEEIGQGVEGTFGEMRYRVQKTPASMMAVDLCRVDKDGPLPLLRFHFEDRIKPDSQRTLAHLVEHRLHMHMLTGDRTEGAERAAEHMGVPLQIVAQTTPEMKRAYVRDLKATHHTVGMVGDGINDAPALAEADVSLAFSPEEQTAATDAADIVMLGSGMEMLADAYHIARRTVRIARRAMIWGISLSICGMLGAAFGAIPALAGSLLQEAIDVGVIVYALRATTARPSTTEN